MNLPDRLRRLEERLPKVLVRWRGLLLVSGLIVVFSVLVSEVLIERYLAFQTAAWDLGIYNQAFFTTVSGHAFFYYTADLPSGNGGHLFVAHFSPILIPLLPFYALAPGPPTLLVLETIAAGLVAVPLYFFARVELGSERWAVLLAGICLASPILLGFIWYDFHSEALLPVAIVCAVVCYRLGSWKLFLVAWFLSLAVIETAAPLLLAFGVLAIAGDYLVGRRPYRSALRRVPPVLWVALAGAVVWLGFTILVVPALFGAPGSSGAYSNSYAANFRVLGANSILAVIPVALLHPMNAASALSFDGTRKVTFLLFFLGTFGFLPLFGRMRYFLPGLIWPVLAFLSNGGGYYAFGDQYAAYTFPFWALAAIDGVARLRQWSAGRATGSPEVSGASPQAVASASERRSGPVSFAGARVRRIVPVIVVVCLLVGLAVGTAYISPLNAKPIDNLDIPHGVPSETPHDQMLHTLIDMIPPQGSVLTTQFLFPEVSSRPNAYVLPVSSYFAGNRTFLSVLDQYVNESDYLLYDTLVDSYGASLMQAYVDFAGFGVLGAAGGGVLYERGWTGAPQLWEPYALNASGGSLSLAPAFGGRASGSYPNILTYTGGSPNGTEIWKGPFAQLVPGTYRVTFTYRVGGSFSGGGIMIELAYHPVLTTITPVDVTSGGRDYQVTAQVSPEAIPLYEENVNATLGTAPVNLTFTVHWPAPAFIDTFGWVLSPNATAELYAVTVTQTAAA